MRFSCLQENLSRGLGIVGRAVATRTTLPITQNVLLTTDGGMLKLSATNLEIAITTWVGAMVEEEGSMTIPARLLTEFISSLPSGTIEASSTDRPRSLNLKSGSFDARISGTDPEEFPPIPSITSDEGVKIEVSTQNIKAAINQTAFASATEESRPVLTGIKVEIEDNELTMAAADGFRLAVHRGRIEQRATEPVSVIVPSKTLTELNRFLGDEQDKLSILVSSSKSQILFKLDNIEMVSQLVHGNFPPYADLLADAMKETKSKIVVSSSDILSTAKSVSIFARDSSGIVRLEIEPGSDGVSGQLIISSRSEEIGENTGKVEGQVDGEAAKIAFNSRYLLDVLSAMDTDGVCLQTSGPSRAGVFKSPESDQYLHLVMPMFINW